MVENGEILHIIHVGHTSIGISHNPIHLKNVLVVPEIKKDILSVSKLTSDYPLNFEFNGYRFVIKKQDNTEDNGHKKES